MRPETVSLANNQGSAPINFADRHQRVRTVQNMSLLYAP